MAQTTTDHETIRRWVEARGGCPAHVKSTGDGGDPGILRIDFPGYSGQQSLERIEWERFFEWFDKNQLAFIYQDRTSRGQQSRFNKLVSRATVRDRARDGGRSARADSADGHGCDGEARQGQKARPDALSMLESQHRQVESLADELAELGPSSAEFRRKFAALADALAIHTTIEEQIFYPGVKGKHTTALLKHSVEEHLQAKQVLATLLQGASDVDVKAELEELTGLTEEHIIEEEHELFPVVRKEVRAADLVGLAQQMEDLMARLQSEGNPRDHIPEEVEQPAPI